MACNASGRILLLTTFPETVTSIYLPFKTSQAYFQCIVLRAVAIGIDLSSVMVVSRATGNSYSLSPEHAVESTICHLHSASFLSSHPTWCQRSTGSIFSDQGWQECGCAALLSLALTNYELTHVNKCGKRRRIVVGCCLFFIRFRGRGIKKWLTACRECAYWRRGGGRWERRGGWHLQEHMLDSFHSPLGDND